MGGDWRVDLERWLDHHLKSLGHKAQQRMCPAYDAGLIGPSDRKSIQSTAARMGKSAMIACITSSVRALESAPLEATLCAGRGAGPRQRGLADH